MGIRKEEDNPEAGKCRFHGGEIRKICNVGDDFAVCCNEYRFSAFSTGKSVKNHPNMRNRTLVVAALLIFVAGLSSCSMYPENPVIALGSKESRIANTWKVVYASDDDGKNVTSDYEESRYTFSEDGSAELKAEQAGTAFVATGDWSLTDEDAVLTIDLTYRVFGIDFTIQQNWNIQKLTQKELWLQSVDDKDAELRLEPF